jgi:hypothetical protein
LYYRRNSNLTSLNALNERDCSFRNSIPILEPNPVGGALIIFVDETGGVQKYKGVIPDVK